MKSAVLHIITWKEEKLYVAKFVELELASQGKTKKEAVKNLREAFDLYMDDDEIGILHLPYIEDVATQTFSLN